MSETKSRSSTRAKLRKIISKAWVNCIEHDYPQKIINGERALQACFYHRLKLAFGELDKYPKRTIFVEPKLSFSNGKRCFPDIVVCDAKKVIAVIELKFLPRGVLRRRDGEKSHSGFDKDIKTLTKVANFLSAKKDEMGSVDMTIVNERYLGIKAKAETYQISTDGLLVWAGIYSKSDDVSVLEIPFVFRKKEYFEGRNWLEIHSLTENGAHPTTHQSSSKTMKNVCAE
ncbi:MAG TPA: hypothetical protein DIS96_09275 [Pusillimonas sp.]|nr:hypothetical protein [Pusillimonas sp.]|tara:strand:- start:159 stop:845 length:687 start_codon:yes stop_codon:yes gene_type:complete